MATLENDSDLAPGLSLQALLRDSKVATLQSLLGPETLEVLRDVGLDWNDRAALASFASSYLDPSEALRDPESRSRIMGMLPIAKARELAGRLGVSGAADAFHDLERAAAAPDALAVLFSFFGVVRDIRAPSVVQPDTRQVIAEYGLFEHQRAAATKVKLALSRAPRKVVLHMPTGSGKTRTAMNIVADHLRLNEPSVVVWLAQSVELLEQADEEFEKAWRACGNRQVDIARFWGASDADLLDVRDGVIVAGLAKMHAFDVRDPAAMLKVADRASLTVIDEAHQAIAPTYSSVLTALQTKRQVNALLGLTATPGRTWSDIAEDKKLSDYFEGQKVALEVEGYDDPVTFLIDNGYLARPNFRVLCGTKIDLDNREFADVSRTQEVPDSFLEKLGRSAERNRVIVDAVRDLTTRHRRVLVFAPSVHSARLLRAILSMEGVEADFVSAETPGAERDRIVRKFRSGGTRPRVLLNFGVFTTGFDAPATSAAVIGRPTLSLVLYSQMVGRATRGPKAGGNAEAEILTVVDPDLPGFGSIAEAFMNWEDVWHERSC